MNWSGRESKTSTSISLFYGIISLGSILGTAPRKNAQSEYNTISALIRYGLGQRVETMISNTYDPSVIFSGGFFNFVMKVLSLCFVTSD